MKVSELITYLKLMPQDVEVVCLDIKDLEVLQLDLPREMFLDAEWEIVPEERGTRYVVL